MPFSPKGCASSPYPASGLQLYCASKEQKEEPPEVFSWLKGEKMNPFWLWWNQIQPTRSIRDFSAILEILSLDWGKKQSKTTPKKATTTKATNRNNTKEKKLKN